VRIVQACPYAWDVPGGVQVHVRQLSEHLRERGHDVTVLSPGHPRLVQEHWVRVVGRPLRVPYNGSVAPICPSLGSMRLVRWSLEEIRPDVIHVHEPFTPSTAMFAALRANAPVVATFHAYAERSRLLAVASTPLRLVWRKLDVKVAVSNAAASFAARRRFGDGFQIVPNGSDFARFRDAKPADLPPGRWVLFVSRLEPRKGFSVALRAFELLARRMHDVRFLVVGEGPERAVLEDLEPAIRERVLHVGAVSNDQLPPYYAAADVFVAPATGGESFGYILVEAMAAGLPVVASAIPGYDEVVRQEVEGLLVTPSDPEAFAGAIERILNDRELAQRLSDAGRDRALVFGWDRVAAEIEEIYEGLTEA